MSLAELGEVADFVNGAAFKPSDWGQVGRRIIRIQNLTDKTKPFNRTEREVSDKYHVKQGDLLVSWSATLGVFEWDEPDTGLLNQHIFKVVPDPKKVAQDYLRHMLDQALRDMEKHLHGSTMKHVNRGEFLSTKIHLPPVDEQHRIASILDKADAIRRKRQQALALVDDFLKSVFLEMFGDPETNPKQLPQEELGKLLERIDSGHSPKCEARSAAEDEIGILKVSSISSTRFKPEENKAVFEGYTIDERNLVHSGDLLFSRKNTYQLVGASAIVENVHGKLALPDLIFRLVPKSDRKIEIPYLWMLLTQDSIRERLRKVAGGSAASMPNIGKERLRSVLLPIAKPEDQVQFTKYYSKRTSLKKKLQDNLLVSEDLFASLSQRAFRGEL